MCPRLSARLRNVLVSEQAFGGSDVADAQSSTTQAEDVGVPSVTSRWKRLARGVARVVSGLTWASVAIAAALVVWSWWTPGALRRDAQPHLAAVAVAFVAQVLRFHIGLACAAAAAGAAVVLRRR